MDGYEQSDAQTLWGLHQHHEGYERDDIDSLPHSKNLLLLDKTARQYFENWLLVELLLLHLFIL